MYSQIVRINFVKVKKIQGYKSLICLLFCFDRNPLNKTWHIYLMAL